MAISLRFRLCLLFACVPWFVHCDRLSQPLYSVVDSVEKMVKYYESNYRDLNLDGLFGLRVVEGQLLVLVTEYKEGKYQHLPKDLVQKLEAFRLLSSEVSHKAIEFIRKDDLEYYNTMEYVVAYPWTFTAPHRTIEPRLKWEASIYKQSVQAELTESTSDSCMAELTGNVQSKTKGCMVTAKCIHIMTQRGLTHYGITHQLLWTMLAGKAGCHQKVNDLLLKTEFKNVENLQLEFCTNNFYEMKTLVHAFLNGTITPRYQDLFLEQQYVCANLGFGEFLNLDYIRDILTWQSPVGCYGKMTKPEQLPVPANKTFMPGAKSFMDEDYDYADVGNNAVYQKPHHFDEDQIDPGIVNMNNNLDHNPGNLGAGRRQGDLKFDGKAPRIRKSRTPQPLVLGNKFDVIGAKKSRTAQPPRHPAIKVARHDVQGIKIGEQTQKPFMDHPIRSALRRLLSVNSDRDILSHGLFSHLRDTFLVKAENGPQRRLLVEKEMSGGCLSHKTAVAAGALVMYLRYLIDPGAEVLAMHNADVLDNGKKRDILQKPAVHRGGPAGNRGFPQGDEAMAVDHPEQGADGDYGPVKGDVDKLDPYQNGDEGEEDGDDADDNHDAGKEDGDDYVAGPNGIYNQDGDAMPVIHMKRSHGKDADVAADRDGDVYSLQGRAARLDERVDVKAMVGENKDEVDHTNEEQYPYYDENEDNNNKLKGRHIRRLPENNNQNHFKPGGNINPNKVARKDSLEPLHFGHDSDRPSTEEYPRRTMVFIFLACFVVLVLFMYRFIKKRRIHIRYYTRTFFNL